MANYINMQQAEYDAIQTSLQTLHTDILTAEASIRKQVEELTQIDGGFYVQDISLKVHGLLVEMGGIISGQLEPTFMNTEEAIASFADAVIRIDVVDN